METIKTYLDNMFAGVLQTEEMIQLKSDIYDNMCEKYQELKNNGKSENEAIGIVISEFGNIDELLEEFGISYEDNKEGENSDPGIPHISLEAAHEYITAKNKIGYLTGIGVGLCILGVIMLIVTSVTFETAQNHFAMNVQGSYIGLILMFILIAGAVALFIIAGGQDGQYEYMKKPFRMDFYVKRQLEDEKRMYQPTLTAKITIGVVLCALCPIPLFISSMIAENNDLVATGGVAMLLLMVAVATFLFITAGLMQDAYQQLLEIGDYAPDKKKTNTIVEVAGSIIWPLVTAVYLYIGFVHNLWHPGWVIYPITGILFGIFASVVNAVSKR